MIEEFLLYVKKKLFYKTCYIFSLRWKFELLNNYFWKHMNRRNHDIIYTITCIFLIAGAIHRTKKCLKNKSSSNLMEKYL